MHQFVRSVKYKVLNHYQQLQPETLHIWYYAAIQLKQIEDLLYTYLQVED